MPARGRWWGELLEGGVFCGPYNEAMSRTVHVDLFGSGDATPLCLEFVAAAETREWQGETPWLAHEGSTGLLQSQYWHQRQLIVQVDPSAPLHLLASGFIAIRRDECDALALLFLTRDMTEGRPLRARVTDPSNPIAKLRHINMQEGNLEDGSPLEAALVATRPIFKRLPGAVIEMYPPRALGSAFGTDAADDEARRAWNFSVHGMLGSAPSFLDAEAEAMRIYRGLRFLA